MPIIAAVEFIWILGVPFMLTGASISCPCDDCVANGLTTHHYDEPPEPDGWEMVITE